MAMKWKRYTLTATCTASGRHNLNKELLMKYVCNLCGYVYDDDVEEVPFSELPDDWTCPLCGAGKDEFQPEA